MSPPARYYGTLAICVVGGVGLSYFAAAFTGRAILRVDPPIFFLLFFGLWVLFMYNTFGIGCPKCGKRLGLMHNGLVHGLPGRRCTRCDALLTERNSN